jgi:O-antigen ligase
VYINLKKYYYLISLFPFFFITGSFLPDLFCSLLSIYFLYFLIKKKELNFLNNNFFYFFLIFYLYINLNSLNSFQPETSLKTSLTFIRIIIFIFFISYFVKKYPKIIDFTYYCFVICLLSLFVDSLAQFFFKINIIGQKVDPGSRISSFFGDELIMGSYVARLLPFIIGLSYLTRLKKKILNSIVIIVSFVLIFLSGERTSFFYLIIFLFFYFLINKKEFLYLLLPISIITIIFGLYNSSSLERIGRHTIQQFKESTYYLSYRHELHILTAYQMFLDKKFFGHGLKSFRNLCSSPKYASTVEDYKEKSINSVVANTKNISDQENLISNIKNAVACNTHPHSIYLEFLAELGIIGFIFLLFLFFYILRKFLIYFLIIITTKKNNNIVFGKYFILLGFLISMIPLIPSGSYFSNYLLIITYFPIGFYLSTKKI